MRTATLGQHGSKCVLVFLIFATLYGETAYAIPREDFSTVADTTGRFPIFPLLIIVIGFSLFCWWVARCVGDRHTRLVVWIAGFVLSAILISLSSNVELTEIPTKARWQESASRNPSNEPDLSTSTSLHIPSDSIATTIGMASTTSSGIQNFREELFVRVDEFKKITHDKTPYVLDVREVEEFEIGHYPGSVHVRAADVLDREWAMLPKDQEVYIFCWSGGRGDEVVKFLRMRSVHAQFIEGGAAEWYNAGGIWEGAVSFRSRYSDNRYRNIITREDLIRLSAGGIMFVDVRKDSHAYLPDIQGKSNVAISALSTPSDQLEDKFSQVASGSRVVTVCNDVVSCFDANIVGIRLEKRGVTYLGRYVTQ